MKTEIWEYQVVFFEREGVTNMKRTIPCSGRRQAEDIAVLVKGKVQRILVEDVGLHWEPSRANFPECDVYWLWDGPNQVLPNIAPPVYSFKEHPRYGTAITIGELEQEYSTLKDAQSVVESRYKETWT